MIETKERSKKMSVIQKIAGDRIDIDFKLELIYPDKDEEKIQELLKENKLRITMDYYLSGQGEVRQTSVSIIPMVVT